ncbi:MAG TPA: YndJ family protein [Candidatus Kapabacteria bacterium]|nr:YndJ family protein [Candidatus Kapabacteria bacterium]
MATSQENDDNRSGYALMSALLGSALWVAIVVANVFGNEALNRFSLLLLLAILVFVPLGLELAAFPGRGAGNNGLYRLARFIQPFAGLAAAASCLLQPGIVAGSLALPWLLFCVVAAVAGLLRLREPQAFRTDQLAITAALLYLPIGGAWLAAHQFNITMLGFGGVTALLTAVHFHFAGFIAPLLAGMAGRHLASMRTPQNGRQMKRAWRMYLFAAPGIIAGPPLVAAGITLAARTPVIEILSALLLTSSVALFAIVTAGPIARSLEPRPALLLRISSAASLLAMLLAALYAVGTYLQMRFITIPIMGITHGVLNSVFALCGLYCWIIVRPAPPPPGSKG